MIKLVGLLKEYIYGFNGPKSSYDEIKALSDKIEDIEKQIWSKGMSAEREWERIAARYLPSGLERDWTVLSIIDLKKAIKDAEFVKQKYNADK